MQLNKDFLLKTAEKLSETLLSQCSEKSSLSILSPTPARRTDTGGWVTRIGNIRENGARLEVWLDRFSGHDSLKLWAGVSTESEKDLDLIVESSEWTVVRRTTDIDVSTGEHARLKKPLLMSEFQLPIVENYVSVPVHCFGVYHITKEVHFKNQQEFLALATGFFEDISRAVTNQEATNGQDDDCSQLEDRKLVTHFKRERSKFLATRCKIRDKYQCKVCNFRFEDDYGIYGADFAEAHHTTALSLLEEGVKTRLDDLITVCANCHRMLHRMPGEASDVGELCQIVKHNRSKKMN